jgi:fructose-bisphosphate aldolase class 1
LTLRLLEFWPGTFNFATSAGVPLIRYSWLSTPPFLAPLQAQGIYPGIKVDTGLQVLPGNRGETTTQGLDGLLDRCKAYKEQGAR